MSEKQTINDLLLEVAKLRKDNEYLTGEVAYWKQQAGVTDWEDSCDTREELEHDCKWMAHAWAPDDKLEKKLYREIIEKLDRQAEITLAECEAERGYDDERQ